MKHSKLWRELFKFNKLEVKLILNNNQVFKGILKVHKRFINLITLESETDGWIKFLSPSNYIKTVIINKKYFKDELPAFKYLSPKTTKIIFI